MLFYMQVAGHVFKVGVHAYLHTRKKPQTPFSASFACSSTIVLVPYHLQSPLPEHQVSLSFSQHLSHQNEAGLGEGIVEILSRQHALGMDHQ